jgi:trigger factor
MNITYTKQKDGKAEFLVSLTEQELSSERANVIREYQASLDVKGFRKGKIPETIVLQRVGEATIMQDALEKKMPQILDDAMRKHDADIYGKPDIKVLKLAPGQPIELSITFVKLPNVTLKFHEGLKLKRRTVSIDDAELEKSLKELQTLYATEAKVDRPAKKGDRAILDFEGFIDHISLEGAKASKHPVLIGENALIPGFEDNIIGMKPGDKKTFSLPFPKNYHKKDIAGRIAEFNVTVGEVYERTLPTLDDAFAAKLGAFKTMDELKKQLRENLHHEAKHKEDNRFEQEMLHELIKRNDIEEIPQAMLDDEKERMLEELEYSVSRDGGKIDDYLASIKKTKEQLKNEFTPRAQERIQTALLLRHIANEHNLIAHDHDIEAHIAAEKKRYPDDPQAQQHMNSETYRRHVTNVLTSQNVIQFLKERNQSHEK